MRRALIALVVQVAAVFLAFLQASHGVLTDEAKYLLNVPYPHPPLVRSILAATSNLPFQEMFWRIIFASLLLQAVWIVWWMGRELSRSSRIALVAGWLLNAAVVLQAGTIMMAPLTAVQGLIFVAILYGKKDLQNAWSYAAVSLLWLISLLTAYQSLLYLPLVVAIFLQSSLRRWEKWIFAAAPVVIALLYGVADPRIAASFLLAGSVNADAAYYELGLGVIRLWLIGGGIVLCVLGVAGAITRRAWSLIGSLILVSLFVIVSFRSYYAILLTPLLLAGTFLLFQRHPPPLPRVLSYIALALFFLVFAFPPSFTQSPARRVMGNLSSLTLSGPVLISGSFGHEWQYETRQQLLRYRSSLIEKSKAVICLEKCKDFPRKGWRAFPDVSVEVWVRE